MIREFKPKIGGGDRSVAEVNVKNAKAEVEAAAKRVDEAKASLSEASAQVNAGGLDRVAVKDALLAEQVEQRLVENAAAALTKAKARLVEIEAEADRLARQTTYDRAGKLVAEAETAFREKYAPSLTAVLDALAIAAAAEKAVAEANTLLPDGVEPLSLPFGFKGAPKFLEVRALDGHSHEVWAGEQFARSAG